MQKILLKLVAGILVAGWDKYKGGQVKYSCYRWSSWNDCWRCIISFWIKGLLCTSWRCSCEAKCRHRRIWQHLLVWLYGRQLSSRDEQGRMRWTGTNASLSCSFNERMFKGFLLQVKQCVTLAINRDGSSGGCCRIAVVSEEGVERRLFTNDQLPTFGQLHLMPALKAWSPKSSSAFFRDFVSIFKINKCSAILIHWNGNLPMELKTWEFLKFSNQEF